MDQVAELRAKLDEAHRRVLTAVEGMEPTVLENQPAVGSWSVRDVVGHMVDWENEMLNAAEHILGGPAPKGQPIKHIQSYNNLRGALWGIEPWSAALGDFQQAHERALRFVEHLTPEQLDTIGPYTTGRVGRLSGLMEHVTGHLEEHAAQLEAWRLRRTGVQEKSRGRW